MCRKEPFGYEMARSLVSELRRKLVRLSLFKIQIYF